MGRSFAHDTMPLKLTCGVLSFKFRYIRWYYGLNFPAFIELVQYV